MIRLNMFDKVLCKIFGHKKDEGGRRLSILHNGKYLA
jgi:hypothetical protein